MSSSPSPSSSPQEPTFATRLYVALVTREWYHADSQTVKSFLPYEAVEMCRVLCGADDVTEICQGLAEEAVRASRDWAVDADVAKLLEEGGFTMLFQAPPSPGFSPTSPAFSPTSPAFSPTSPAYEPTFSVFDEESPAHVPDSSEAIDYCALYDRPTPTKRARVATDFASSSLYCAFLG